jgi:hypothetical protein
MIAAGRAAHHAGRNAVNPCLDGDPTGAARAEVPAHAISF